MNALLCAIVLASPEPLTLSRAMEAALQNNPSAHNIDETIVQADVLVQKAWSILLPRLTADATITRNNQEIAFDLPDFSGGGGPAQEVIFQELWGQRYGFSANLTLLNARSIPLLQKAYDNADRAEHYADFQRSELLLAVASAYYQARAAQELVAVAEDNLENARQFLRMSQARVRVGQATKIDELRAELDAKEAEKELHSSKDGLTLAHAGLAKLTGIDGSIEVAQPPAPQPIGDELDALEQRAHSERLDLKAATVSEIMAERDEVETYLKWLPTFDVTWAWSWDSAAGFADDQSSWRLIFGARWTLFDGGMRLAELSERESLTRMAHNNIEQLKLQISEEVERAVVEVEKRQRNALLAEQQVALADETHRLVGKQYEVGMATSLDLLTASSQLRSTRVAQVLETLQHDLAVLALNRSAGELLRPGD